MITVQMAKPEVPEVGEMAEVLVDGESKQAYVHSVKRDSDDPQTVRVGVMLEEGQVEVTLVLPE